MENGYFSSSSETSNVSSVAPSDDVEVQKLKNLVKKLEKQNEHLRTRTGRLSSSASKLSRHKAEITNAGGDAYAHQSFIGNLTHSTDDIQVLEEDDDLVANISVDDEFSWLYQSPNCKIKSRSLSPISHRSPQDWLREEVENPSTPQLASAKRNIMYKLNGSLDRNSPDLKYLRQSVEKRLHFTSDDYKPEDATDIRIIARLQQEELKKDSDMKITPIPFNNTHSPQDVSSSPHHRRGSHEGDHERNSSSGSPHHTHHLPLPSQTMTTVHGLYPAHGGEEETLPPTRRSTTPTRVDRQHKAPERISFTPRSRSPARKTIGKNLPRRSLPNPSRSLVSSNRQLTGSVGNSLPTETSNGRAERQSSPAESHQPVIKSSLVTPPSRLSRMPKRSGLPSPGASPALPSAGRGIPAPRSSSPMVGQLRRSLPRPSQTSTTMKYMPNKPSPPQTNKTLAYSSNLPSRTPKQTQRPVEPPNDIWGDDDEVY